MSMFNGEMVAFKKKPEKLVQESLSQMNIKFVLCNLELQLSFGGRGKFSVLVTWDGSQRDVWTSARRLLK